MLVNNKVRLAKDGMFEVNKDIAGLVPMASKLEQADMLISIRVGGQICPVIIWQGKLVDGRCRQLALAELGMDIIYEELADNVPEETVRAYIKSMNTRRNLDSNSKKNLSWN